MDELIKALRYCGNYEDREGCAEECPYFYDRDCPKRIMFDAADALEAAEKRIADLEAQLPKLPDRQEFLAKGSFIEEPLSRPKEGEWIDEQRGRWIYAKCNLCGKVQDARSSYCPNCGARMRTVTDCHTLEEGER